MGRALAGCIVAAQSTASNGIGWVYINETHALVPSCSLNSSTPAGRAKRCAPILVPFLGGIAFAAGSVLGQNIFGGENEDTNRQKRSAVSAEQYNMIRDGTGLLILTNDTSSTARFKRSIVLGDNPRWQWYFANISSFLIDPVIMHSSSNPIGPTSGILS